MKKAVIVDALRTPIGAFGGKLKDVPAVELGQELTREALKKFKTNDVKIDEVIFGQVFQAGQGQNTARQISLGAGISEETPAWTVNKVCGSGLKAVSLGAQAIMLGESEIVIAGGVENMSQAPYLLPKTRWGLKMGDGQLVDSMLKDGLTDGFSGGHMGLTAENMATKWQITRDDQDRYALQSQQRAEKAVKEGRFKDEIVPITLTGRKGETTLFDQDEYPRFGMNLESLQKLKPAFQKDGTVTAGNSSGINDGGAVLVLMSEEKAYELDKKPLAFVTSFASAGVDPDYMGYGPVPAVKAALNKAKLSIDEIDLFEINEAFAVQMLVVTKELGLKEKNTNINGGAIALGHPIGCSGARVLVTLIHEMMKQNARSGLAGLCIGGGQGIAMTIRR